MKLNILSDLHLGFAAMERPENDADVVVLAGDVSRPREAAVWALRLDKPVIYVLGNHEFYGSSIDGAARELARLCEGTQVDFQVGANSYLYGTRFFSYLALTYGIDKTMDWLRRPEDSKAFYSSNFKHVFGKSLDQAWSDWIAFEQKFQQANLARLAQYPLSAPRHNDQLVTVPHTLDRVSRFLDLLLEYGHDAFATLRRAETTGRPVVLCQIRHWA